jgi:hypothetical protein
MRRKFFRHLMVMAGLIGFCKRRTAAGFGTGSSALGPVVASSAAPLNC